MNIHLEQYQSTQQKQVIDFIMKMEGVGLVVYIGVDSDLDDPDEFYIKPGGMFYVLFDEDTIIGTIGIIKRKNNVAELKRFYVDKNLRGKGYGTMLFDQAITFCKENGFKKVEIEIGKAFKHGDEFYKHRGFTLVREDEESYYMEKLI